MKRILINSSYGDELRVALVDGAKLYDFDTESPEINLLKGSIFKATVSRIETSLDAAFVNFGSERHGFLPLKDLSNEYFETHKGKKKCILEEGQEIVVQVTKEERGTKGAALSTQIGLAGRFLVLMPNSSRSGGISRRISGDERDEIKKSLDKLNIPESMSVIVRTNGLGRSTEELSLDLNYLLALWDEVCISTPNAKAPSLIYKDDKLIVRVVRDYFKEDIEEILVDDKDTYDEALKFMQAVIPDHAEKIKFYNEDIPLFNRYQIESQIELAFQREISLNSGGSIVIDPTEAMTAIDVNSARSTKGKDIEETAFKTNIEAAKEVARQLRLRDVGGLVVIDFIDMLDESNQNKVESAFRKAVYSDRARVQVSSISRFGLLEVSRQRLRPSLNETYDIEHVLVRGPRSLGQSILRIVSEDAAKESTGEIQVYVPADVASYLLNEKRNDILSIEQLNKIRILVIADPYKSRPYYKVVRVKSSDIKNTDSYNLTPPSPEPDINWRDNKNIKNTKPLVGSINPPKMPKKKQEGIISWIKSITGIETQEEEVKKKPKTKRRPRVNNKKTNNNAKKGFKKTVSKNPKAQNKSNKPNKNTLVKNNNTKPKPKPKSKPKPKTEFNKKVTNDEKNTNKAVVESKSSKGAIKNTKSKSNNSDSINTKKKSPGIIEIDKTKKEKKKPPTRALNDPRNKNE